MGRGARGWARVRSEWCRGPSRYAWRGGGGSSATAAAPVRGVEGSLRSPHSAAQSTSRPRLLRSGQRRQPRLPPRCALWSLATGCAARWAARVAGRCADARVLRAVAPTRRGAQECCGNDCAYCVYVRYWEQLQLYDAAVAAQTGGAAPSEPPVAAE